MHACACVVCLPCICRARFKKEVFRSEVVRSAVSLRYLSTQVHVGMLLVKLNVSEQSLPAYISYTRCTLLDPGE